MADLVQGNGVGGVVYRLGEPLLPFTDLAFGTDIDVMIVPVVANHDRSESGTGNLRFHDTNVGDERGVCQKKTQE